MVKKLKKYLINIEFYKLIEIIAFRFTNYVFKTVINIIFCLL